MLGVPPGQNLDHGRRRQVDNTAVFAHPATNPQTPGGPTMDLQILTTISTGVALAALVWTLSRGRSEVRTHMGKIRFWPPGFSTGSRAIAGGKPTATTTGDTMGIDTIGHLTEIILGVISTAAFLGFLLVFWWVCRAVWRIEDYIREIRDNTNPRGK